jgi:hypothetical protein
MLLKADAGVAGEGWSDNQIARALDTGLATIARTRQQLAMAPPKRYRTLRSKL